MTFSTYNEVLHKNALHSSGFVSAEGNQNGGDSVVFKKVILFLPKLKNQKFLILQKLKTGFLPSCSNGGLGCVE